MKKSTVPFAILCTLVFWIEMAHAQSKAVEEPAVALPDVSRKYQALETLARGLFYLETLYVDPQKVEQDKMITYALRGIVNELDPHTMLMPQKAFKQLTIDTQGKFGGVGIIVSQERGKLIVVSPIVDTPAHKAGVLSGDEIVKIDSHVISEMKNSDAVELMRGEPGSKIVLTIKRKDQTLDFTLVREVIKVKSVRTASLNDGIYIAKIASFQEDTASELQEFVKKNAKSMKGLILDLRDNPGGLLDQAVKMVDLFIESGVIVSTVGRDPSQIEREFAHKRDTFGKIPLTVLINGGSASASEIVAGALQDLERSLIIGTTSFGKGSVQTLVSLPDGSGLKLTVARYYTPNDRSIQARGIDPDIYIPYKNKPDQPANSKKESDLDKHIESHDLSDMAQSKGLLQAKKTWPEEFRSDNQLTAAFGYLRGWNVFNYRPKTGKIKSKKS